jgi:hypothetical protein
METNDRPNTIDLDKLIENLSYLDDVVFSENNLQPETFPDHANRLAELAGSVAYGLRPDGLDTQKIEELAFASVFLNDLSSRDNFERETTELSVLYDLADTLGIEYEQLMSIFKDYETQSSQEAKYIKIMLDVIVIIAHIENVINATNLNNEAHIRTLGIKKSIGIERHFERRAEYAGIDQARYSDELPEFIQFRLDLVNKLASLVDDPETN